MLRENGYQESIISNIFKRLTKQQLVLVITRNISHKYTRGRDQNEYKFTVH